MCDLAAGGVIVSWPVEGAAAAIANYAVGVVAERYGAHRAASLRELLAEAPPAAWAGASQATTLTAPPSMPFVVERYEVPSGAELSFVDEVRNEYLDVIVHEPAVLDELADPARRLALSPDWKLHPGGIPEAVPEPFDVGTHHAAYLHKVGLDTAQPNEAAGVTIAVLDNGFDGTYWHGAPAPVPVHAGIDLVANDPSTEGHGTLVAALVALSAPGADVVPIRMAGTESTEWDTLHGLARAVQLQADVVTLSYRQVLQDIACPTCGLTRQAARSEVFQRLLAWAAAAGWQNRRAILVAAGNDGVGMLARPAAYPDAIPVAALDASGSALASFSNWDAATGRTVFALPGAAVALGTTSGLSYAGTSFATAYAAATYAVGMGRYGTTDADTVGTILAGRGSVLATTAATVPLLV